MTTPTALAELITKCVSGAVDERPGFVAFDAAFADGELRRKWLDLRSAPPEFMRAVAITHEQTDDPVDPDDTFTAQDLVRITINFVSVQGEARLLFGRSFATAVPNLSDFDTVRIADLNPSEAFWTDRSRFELWTVDGAEPYAAAPLAPNPRNLVKDFTSFNAVPTDVRPILLRREPAQRGDLFALWTQHAVRGLLAALVNQVAGAGPDPSYILSGPPSRQLRLSDADAASLFDRLTPAAGWIYREARDAETRHLLFSNELARTWREGAISEFGVGALDSARAAYQAYVRSGSRETLKALSELRKAVIEEAQKVAQRAQDMAGALWKDIAVAAIPLGLKALPSGSAGNLIAAWAAVGAAVFLFLSFGIQAYINQRLIERLAESRKAWKRSLQVALSDEELDEISERPLVGGVEDYERVRTIVGFVYLALAAGLIAFAVVQFQSS